MGLIVCYIGLVWLHIF